MAQATYTPTHCPQTGRKFTRAERKAANKAKFAASLASKPTKASKRTKSKNWTKGVKERTTLVETTFLPTPKRKHAKASKPTKASLMRLTKAALVDLLMQAPTPPSKPKRKPTKARKATPQERTADKQERAAHGPKGVGPITPEPTALKPDMAKARKVGKAQGERNRTKRAHKLALKWAFDGTYGGMFLPTQQAELKRLLGDVDVSTYEDVMAASL